MKDAATDTANLITKVDACTQTAYEDTELEEEAYDSDSTVIYAATASEETAVGEEEYDSDATRLDSPTTIAIGSGDEGDCGVNYKEIGIKDHDADSDSSGSYVETYTSDPAYDGPAYQSLPCSRHGVSYTPPGWKRIMVKRRKLEFTEAD